MKEFVEINTSRSSTAFRKSRIFELACSACCVHVYTFDRERADIYFDNVHAASVAYKKALEELNNV